MKNSASPSSTIVVKSKIFVVILCCCLAASISTSFYWSTKFWKNFDEPTDDDDDIISHKNNIGRKKQKVTKSKTLLRTQPTVMPHQKQPAVTTIVNTNRNNQKQQQQHACREPTLRTKNDLNYYGYQYRKSNASIIPKEVDKLHTNNDYNSRQFMQNFIPYCDDIQYLTDHQNPASSEILFEEHHDQYSITNDDHRIQRLGSGVIKLSQEEQKQTASEALQYVATEFNQMGIPFMLFFGTLLGAYRHHDFIPWDDDADIIILSRHAAELRSILLQRAKDTIRLNNNNNSTATALQQQQQSASGSSSSSNNKYQWIVRAGTDSNAIPVKVVNLDNGRYVDIFAVHPKFSTKQVTVAESQMFGSYPIEDVFPTRPCVFGTYVYPCPNSPESVLNRKYNQQLGVIRKHQPLMKGLPEYRGVVATLAETKDGRIN